MTPLFFDYPVSVSILYTCYEKDTLETVEALTEALTSRGHVVRRKEVVAGRIAAALKVPGDIVINLVEDDDGDWSAMERLSRKLLLMGRVVMGMNMESLGIVMNKVRVKKLLSVNGLRSPGFRIIKRRQKIERVLGLEFPLIVKPAREHASLGITQDSVVIDQRELVDRVKYLQKKFPGEVLVEEYIEGRELHVTVMGDKKHCAVFPYAEIDFLGEYADNWNVYSYDAKWVDKSWEYWSSPTVCPVVLPRKVETEIDKLTSKAFKSLGCCDVVRFDLRLDDKNRPWIIDVNVMPSLKNSEYDECWLSAKALGWSYEQMIETIVAVAYRRVYGRLPDKMRERGLMLAVPKI